MAEAREAISRKDTIIIFSQGKSVQKYTLGSSGITVEFSQQEKESIQDTGDKIEFLGRGELGRIVLARTLRKEKDLLEIAPIIVEIIEGRAGFSSEDWDVFLGAPSDFVPSEHDKNVFINSSGEEVEIKKAVLREQREGKEMSVLQIIQTHSPTGITKVIKTPLNINMAHAKRVFSKGNGSSFREIRGLVGAQVTYPQ